MAIQGPLDRKRFRFPKLAAGDRCNVDQLIHIERIEFQVCVTWFGG
jgi:hypothetical protein